MHLKVTESNKAWSPTSYHRFYKIFSSGFIFPDTTQNLWKNFATSFIILFTTDEQYLNFARIFGLLFETHMKVCSLGNEFCIVTVEGCRSESWRYWLLSSLSLVGRHFCFLVLLRVYGCKVFLSPSPPFFMSFSLQEVKWQNSIILGIFFKQSKWYFYHINLKYAISSCWSLSDWEWIVTTGHVP